MIRTLWIVSLCCLLVANATLPVLEMMSNSSWPIFFGMTLTRDGNMATTKYGDVNILNMEGSFIRKFSIPSATYLTYIASSKDAYFVTEALNVVYFVGEDGSPRGGDGKIDIGTNARKPAFRDSTLWVTSELGVHKITFNTTCYNVISSKIIAQPDESSQFGAPEAIGILSDRLIITCGHPYHNMHIFDLNGNRMSPPIGKHGSADGEFDYPVSVAADEYDRVYIADHLNGRVSLFSNNGTFLKHLLTKGKELDGVPNIMFYKDGFLYLQTFSQRLVYIFKVQ